jgi:hypothetical protein
MEASPPAQPPAQTSSTRLPLGPCYRSSAEEPLFASGLSAPAGRPLAFSSSAEPPVKKQIQFQFSCFFGQKFQFSYSNSLSVLSNGNIIQNNSVGWCVDVIEKN